MIERYLARAPAGVKITELSKLLNIHRATIYRDIDELSQAGIPIWQKKGMVGILT